MKSLYLLVEMVPRLGYTDLPPEWFPKAWLFDYSACVVEITALAAVHTTKVFACVPMGGVGI